ncbi:MAG: chemotaxis protein CheW [Bryobacteraceae bacterium]|nr:chemotaxis protein CheW [Bryobacteraceae bacterium]MDW8379084.1 chemotaxis protein CheW [Bryobacterales bacterium]
MTKPMMTTRRVIRCWAGPHSFCFDHDLLDGVQSAEALYPSRGADGSIGWVRWGEQKIPVFRLTDQLGGLARGFTGQGTIAILRRGDHSWAFLVDKIGSAVEVAYERIFPLPAVTGNGNGRFPWVVVEEQELDLYLAPGLLVPAAVSGVAEQPPLLSPQTASPVRLALEQGAQPGAEPRPPAQKQLITFTLEHRFSTPVRFALSAGQALEIVSHTSLVTVPQAPVFVRGLINWRSLPVPVVDLAAWFGMRPTQEGVSRRLMICRGTVGRSKRDPGLLAISPIADVKKLDLPLDYRPWPDPVNWNASLALGVYSYERNLLIVPDLDAILLFQGSISGPIQ